MPGEAAGGVCECAAEDEMNASKNVNIKADKQH
jgi:hypothetical protein